MVLERRPAADSWTNRLAAAVRALYCFHRQAFEELRTGQESDWGSRPIPNWDGGVDRNGVRHQNAWARIAAFVAARQLELPVYLESAFADPMRVAPPSSSELVSDAAVSAYSSYRAEAGSRASVSLRSQQTSLLVEVGKAARICECGTNAAARQVLMDPALPYSSLFRYCVARSAGADDIARHFEASALYGLTRGFFRYSEGWGEFIPEDLATSARGLLARLCAGNGIGEDR